VLRGVDLSVGDGELVALVGPSGSGKTTLLRAVAGLDQIDAGAIRIGHVDVTHADTAARDVAMVFQTNVLYPFRDVEGNVGFPLEVQHRPKPEIAARVEAEGRALRLERLMHRKPSQLSAGHQQLVQIARALVRAPSLFLMDEPLARLDALLRVDMRSELRLVQRGYKVTTLYVTNDPVEAMAVCDRLAVLIAGEIVQISEPADVYAHPVSREVAELTGDLSTMLFGVSADESGYWLDHDGFRVRVWAESLAPYVGLDVEVGFRPEQLFPDANGMYTIVDRVVPHGPYVITECSMGGETVRVRTDRAFGARGDEVGVALSGGHVFDPIDGRTAATWG
jgi:ABC-type sugar transport system ATPase subunit